MLHPCTLVWTVRKKHPTTRSHQFLSNDIKINFIPDILNSIIIISKSISIDSKWRTKSWGQNAENLEVMKKLSLLSMIPVYILPNLIKLNWLTQRMCWLMWLLSSFYPQSLSLVVSCFSSNFQDITIDFY